MAAFDDLPADQKAVLQLVLRQGRTYDEIAGLLKISPEAVRDRALTALDTLGPPDGAGLAAEEQDAVGDYLMGQQGASARASTRALLEGSPPGRTWARSVAAALRGAGIEAELPEIPAEPSEVDDAFDALQARHVARQEHERSSRLGGILLLAGLGLTVAVVLIIALGLLSDDDDDGGSDAPAVTASTPVTSSTPAATTPTATTPATATSTTGASVEAQVNLKPPTGSSSKALGVANVVAQDGERAIAVVGQDLAGGNRYVLWLRNGDRVKFLGFFPAVAGSGTDKGKLQGLVGAPSDLSSYEEMLVTREPSSKPTRPTTIVLQGTIGG